MFLPRSLRPRRMSFAVAARARRILDAESIPRGFAVVDSSPFVIHTNSYLSTEDRAAQELMTRNTTGLTPEQRAAGVRAATSRVRADASIDFGDFRRDWP